MKRQPGLEVAEKLSILQKSLNSKTRKMKELAGEINMYQAKVNLMPFRPIRWSTISNAFKKRYNKSGESTTSKRRENKSTKKTKNYSKWTDSYTIINMHLFHTHHNLPTKNKFSYATAKEYCELVKRSIDRQRSNSKQSIKENGVRSPLRFIPKKPLE